MIVLFLTKSSHFLNYVQLQLIQIFVNIFVQQITSCSPVK